MVSAEDQVARDLDVTELRWQAKERRGREGAEGVQMPGLKFLFLRKKNSFAKFGGEGEVWGIWTSRQPVLEGLVVWPPSQGTERGLQWLCHPAQGRKRHPKNEG